MPKHRNPRLFWLHFEGAGTDSNALPAQVLAKSLQQVQRIVHLLAKIHRGGPILYKAEPPLAFDVKFDREHHLYELRGEFNIVISARSFSELKESLDAELDMLWVEYAKEDPQVLSLDARELRKQLLSRRGIGG